MAQNREIPWVPIGLTLGALLLYDKLFGSTPYEPGGDVFPAPNPPGAATLTAAQAGIIADAIEEAVWGGGVIASPWEDDAAIAEQLLRAKNDADVRLLLNAYGRRGTILNPMGLAETIASYLDDEYRLQVNASYTARGISIQW